MMSDWIIGKHAVQEALKSGREVEKIVFAEGVNKHSVQSIISDAKSKQIAFQWVPRTRLDQLSEQGNHQGVIAQVAAYQYATLDDLFREAEQKKEMPFFVILDGIEDPHNLGSILRTADAAGVHGVIIPKRRAVGLTSVVAKTSAGAIEHVPVVRVTNLNRTVETLKTKGIWVLGTDGDAKASYEKPQYDMPIALIIGNEGKGISQQLKKKCDFLVRIPMKGKISSLNASVAAGVLMYQIFLNGRKSHG
ncbi:23S rRNA (guanosine(2251)-2'-O)-methyltransferase RlmB [Hazenella sp. IB182357]|uniref:23S rRNA (Guanosine(2251)-2'-O)-methyltransferase RlmB n=1 Tax=Polycladospora coralii TaxID=2771432 RepID=A0A926N6L8_9BACL|nr:23S rRNA (guanosine(2251)-2'-O)-methyltransferase RlmB [Polycladospora coralii]MBD1372386.1 23S rRNA (guanosine(2251)-2'-O)-methyltransferase RlmB [Polycladospora coralii]MBS7531424.1 23S rRNA (guanosine(2251)-2'-O)-methyltransferase RlmB [Polycladospora coralii]